MTIDEVVVAVLDGLAAADIPCMIVGSLASNVHGIPRSTRDADLVIDLQPGRLQHLSAALPEGLTLDSQGSFETVTGTNDVQRPKDRDDIRNILAIRSPELDWDYLRHWATEHGTWALLEGIRDSLPADLGTEER